MKFQTLETHRRSISSPWKFLFSTALIAMAMSAGAQTNQPERLVIGATNVISEQLFAFAGDLEIAGTVSDDTIALSAGSALLTGVVSNDLWMAGIQGVEVRGSVGDHARLASMVVLAAGEFQRDLYALGKTINLATNNVVHGNVDLRGDVVAVEGAVGSNLTVAANVVTINGHIRGNVEITARQIELLRGTKIDGDLTYTSPQELLFNRQHVTVGGKLVHKPAPEVNPADLIRAQFTISAAMMIGALMTGGLFLACFPRFAGNTIRILRHSPMRCSLTGFFVAMTVILIAPFALAAVIAAPFGFTLAATLGVLMYLGNIVVALLLGGLVMRHQGTQSFGRALLALTVGTGLVYAAKSLPLVGLYISFFVWFAGMGALVLAMLHSQRMPAHPPELPQTPPPPTQP